MWVEPGWNRISFEGGACKQLVRFLSGLSAARRSCQYSWQVVQPLSKLWEKIHELSWLASQLHVWTLPIRSLIRFKVTRFSTCKRGLIRSSTWPTSTLVTAAGVNISLQRHQLKFPEWAINWWICWLTFVPGFAHYSPTMVQDFVTWPILPSDGEVLWDMLLVEYVSEYIPEVQKLRRMFTRPGWPTRLQ